MGSGLRHSLVFFVSLAFGVVAIAFAIALFVSQRTTVQIRSLVADVTENANPSVLHLVQERDILWRLQVTMLNARERIGRDQAVRFDVQRALARQDEEWRLYDATPQFPGEKAVRDRVLLQVDDLKVLLRAIAGALDDGDSQRAARLIDLQAPGAFRKALDGLMELTRLNQTRGHASALRVEAIRRVSALLALVLGSLALVLSIVLSTAILRAMRKVARVQAERDAVLERRAVEHEIFAARVAHDVRGPLTAAQLWSARGTKAPTEEGRALAAEKVGVSLQRAAQIVDDLYAIAHANVSRHEVKQTPLKEAVKSAVDEISLRATSAGIDLTSDPIPEVSVAASPGVVASILSNLLANAVKYAGRGSRVLVQALAGERVRVNVADTGVGIPSEVQRRIFEPYVRGDNRNDAGGLGLGLATVKELVERSGGTCGVESKPGAGSLFWFELPRVNNSRPAPV